MCAAGATTTVYPTTNADDTAYILGDAECRFVFAEDDEQIAKLVSHRNELPHLAKIITFDGNDRRRLGHLPRRPGRPRRDLPRRAPGRHRREGRGDRARPALHPDLHLGHHRSSQGRAPEPQGVLVYEGEAIRVQDILDENDLQFLWLPMAHSFGKVLLSTQMACGFATAVDGRVEKIVDNCAEVKPTFMGAAPRIFEKAYGRIQTMQAAEGGAKEKLFHKAFATGLKVERAQARGQVGPGGPEAPARPLRQARLQQGACPLRWPRPLLHLRLRRAQPGDRRVVQRRRHRDPRGLRHDRELRGRRGQPPRRQPHRHRRPGASRAPRSRSATATRC